jgi:hypothetical protein
VVAINNKLPINTSVFSVRLVRILKKENI